MNLEYAWSQIEFAIVILCVSIVIYRSLFVNIKKNLFILTKKLIQNKQFHVVEINWTDMNNNKNVSMRWAVVNDFVDRIDVNYDQINISNSHHVLNYASFIVNVQEMKSLSRCSMIFRNLNDLILNSNHTMLRFSENDTFKLNFFV